MQPQSLAVPPRLDLPFPQLGALVWPMLTSQAQPHLDPWPCSQLMWLLQTLGPQGSLSLDPSPIFFLVGVSVEPQKGRTRHLCPLMAAHLPHSVLTPRCCFLQVPLEMPCPGPEGSVPEGHGFPSAAQLVQMSKAQAGGVDSGPQPSMGSGSASGQVGEPG